MTESPADSWTYCHPLLQVNLKLTELANLLPDMVGKLEHARADVLYSLLSDLPGLADKLMALHDVMPNTNVSLLMSKHPKLLLETPVSVVVVCNIVVPVCICSCFDRVMLCKRRCSVVVHNSTAQE